MANAFDVLSSIMAQPNNSGPGGNLATSAMYAYPPPLDRSILDPCQHPVYIDPSDQPCSHFFQQRGAIDYKSYLRLKQEERLAVIQYHAAVKIQAFWRGFLIRSNWKILVAAAIKIQSWVRGHFGRKKARKIIEEREAKVRQKLMEEAAIKIQAAWRGYISRKNKLDFKKYKNIQQKNEALRRSIARINELETALLKTLHGGGSGDTSVSRASSAESQTASSTKTSETYDPCAEMAKTGDERLSHFLNNIITPSVESFLIEKIPDYVNELSESRIAELYAYLANLESEMKQEQELEHLVKRLGGTHMLTAQQQARLEESRRIQKERANHILDISKLVMIFPLKKKLELEKQKKEGLNKDSVDSMFPAVPERPDVIKPDPIKVEALKDAIRMFRQQGEANEDRDLKRKHVLLRTKACPGVYSDIYTTELTEMEQKLKSLKFWKGSLAAERIAKRERLAKENRLKRLFAHALKLSNKRREVEEEEDDFDEEETTAEEGLPIDLYGEYEGEMGPEDDEYDDDDDDDDDGYQNANDNSSYYMPPDPKPPPPTPNTVNTADDNQVTDDDLAASGRGGLVAP